MEIELSAALEEVDAQFVFAQMVQFALIIGANEDNEAEHGTLPSLTEFAAFHLYPRFDKGGSTESDAVERATKAISTLNAQRLMRNMGPDKSDPTAFSEAVRQAQSHSEHVRGSAYPPQTRRKIEGLFGPFYTELKNMTGISPPRVLALLDVFEPTVQNQVEANRKRFHAAQRALSTVGTKQPDGAYKPGPDIDLFWRAANEFEAVLLEAPFTIFVSFAAVRAAISDFGEDEWAALERLCGTSKATRRQMMEPIEVKARPIYFYPDDRFTLLDISSVYDAVFGAYDGIARAEEKLRDRYGHHVADWMEREVETYLLRLFPSANVFRNLDYPDPDKTAATAELDLIVQWGPFVVPIEVKGRQFHIEAQTGNEARLRSDLRSNIAEAFWQARRLIRYLRSVPIGTLKERHSERTVEIEWQKMKRCFPIVVTLEHFGGLATQLATLGDGKWFQAGTYPWAVSLADFDLVTRFCGSPDVLLHYVQRRIQLQESGKNIHGDELDIFGLYLDSRLHPSRFWQRTVDGEEFTMLHLTGGSERFDSWMRAEHDPSASRPEIRLMLPPRLSAAINALRQSGDHEGRWIAVSLLDLSPDATERLEHDIGRIIAAPMPQGQLPRITFPDGDLLVVAMANRGLAPKAFRGLLIERTSREKYRARCERAVGLGFDPRFPGGGFVGAIWIEFPWIQNPELDAALDASKVRIMQEAEGKKPGRNDPCPCGSGKKFKKCCSDRLEFTG